MTLHWDNGKALTINQNGKGIEQGISREAVKDFILTAEDEELLSLTNVEIKEPESARIHHSVKCDICGEGVMETRICEVNGRKVCIPCSEK